MGLTAFFTGRGGQSEKEAMSHQVDYSLTKDLISSYGKNIGYKNSGSYNPILENIDREYRYGRVGDFLSSTQIPGLEGMANDQLSQLYSSYLNPGQDRSQYNRTMADMMSGAKNLYGNTNRQMLSSGLNDVASKRMSNKAQSDYMRNAQNYANLAKEEYDKKRKELALAAAESQYGSNIADLMSLMSNMDREQAYSNQLMGDRMSNLAKLQADIQEQQYESHAKDRASGNKATGAIFNFVSSLVGKGMSAMRGA